MQSLYDYDQKRFGGLCAHGDRLKGAWIKFQATVRALLQGRGGMIGPLNT